jgi:hypothetical protein
MATPCHTPTGQSGRRGAPLLFPDPLSMLSDKFNKKDWTTLRFTVAYGIFMLFSFLGKRFPRQILCPVVLEEIFWGFLLDPGINKNFLEIVFSSTT